MVRIEGIRRRKMQRRHWETAVVHDSHSSRKRGLSESGHTCTELKNMSIAIIKKTKVNVA